MNQYTIFDTPIVAPICRVLSKFLLFIAGWRVEGTPPRAPKYVLIAAPHTSNWDFYFTLLMAFDYKLKIFWMGKDSLFKGWKGPIMRWLGGISVDRSAANNLVDLPAILQGTPALADATRNCLYARTTERLH